MFLARLVTLVLIAIFVSPATESSVMSTAPAVVAVVKDAPLPPGSASVDGPASASLYQPLDRSLISGPLQCLLKVSMRRWLATLQCHAIVSLLFVMNGPMALEALK